MKVSIIIPFKEDRGWLKDAVQSAKNQHDFELDVDYEVILSQSKFSLGYNYNRALEKAKGDFIKGLAEDDMLTPNCLFHLWTKAVADDLDFVCADAINFKNTPSLWRNKRRVKSKIPKYLDSLARANTIHGGTVLYRRDTMPNWNESLWTAEEFEVALKMARMGLKFGYIPEVVYLYRLHDEMKSGAYRGLEEYRKNHRQWTIFKMAEPYMIKQRIHK